MSSHSVPAPPKGGGLALAGFVLAIITVILCWIPIINNLAAGLGVIAVVLGFLGWRRARKGKATGGGLAVAAMVLALVGIAGVIATQALFVQVVEDVEEAVNDAADGEVAKTDADAAAAAEALTPGAEATVGDYTVSVDEVVLNADAAIAKANQFNEAPEGQYVLATMTVTYHGEERGTPWLDLTAELSGSDDRVYDASTCSAVTPRPMIELPELKKGGTVTGDVCFDVPAAAVKAPTVSVEDTLSWDTDDVRHWSVR